jgi:transcriptional regulator with XRE-family HTH domain
MATDKLTKKLDGLISKEPSKWLQDAEWRNANRNWLKKSAKIALLVLDRMDELGWSQKDLAKAMGTSQQYISKLCKGHENLTLKNIALLEEKLGIDLSIGEKAEKTKQSIIIQEVLRYNIVMNFSKVNDLYNNPDNYINFSKKSSMNYFKLNFNEVTKQTLANLNSNEAPQFLTKA